MDFASLRGYVEQVVELLEVVAEKAAEFEYAFNEVLDKVEQAQPADEQSESDEVEESGGSVFDSIFGHNIYDDVYDYLLGHLPDDKVFFKGASFSDAKFWSNSKVLVDENPVAYTGVWEQAMNNIVNDSHEVHPFLHWPNGRW